MEKLAEHSRCAMYMIARDPYLTTLLNEGTITSEQFEVPERFLYSRFEIADLDLDGAADGMAPVEHIEQPAVHKGTKYTPAAGHHPCSRKFRACIFNRFCTAIFGRSFRTCAPEIACGRFGSSNNHSRKISGKDCLGNRYIQRESPITEKSLEAGG